jgi:hypothetical protein
MRPAEHHAIALHGAADARRASSGPGDQPQLSVELARYREAWRQTLETVKATLADLESAVVKDGVEPTPSISGLVERLVAVSTAAAEAAGQQIRAEARAEVARAQAELLRERDDLKAISQQLDAERLTRARSEAALQDAQRMRQQVMAAYESDIASLRAELARLQRLIDSERAERAGIIAAIRQAVKVEGAGSNASFTTPSETTALESNPAEATIVPPAAPLIEAVAVNAERVPDPDPDPALVAYARELLGKAEAMYRADVSARRNTSELIDRLTSNLRRARLMFARRMGVTDLNQTTVFEHELAEVLNTTEEPSFSRHLGIAAYESLSKTGR